MPIKKMSDLDLQDKRVLIREDLNAPIKNGKITNDARLQAAVPTIKQAIDAGAAVIITSHLGRPKEGEQDFEHSLQPVAYALEDLLMKPVRLETHYLDGITIEPGQIVLCENVRFNEGEKANNDALAKKMASLCDVFVMDAFATAHRAQASTHGIAKYAPIACAGPLLLKELDAIHHALENPDRPLVAIVGGAKVSSKLLVLKTLVNIADRIILGGGIANTFIAAAGYEIGKSLHEPEYVYDAKAILEEAKARGTEIPIPTDVVVAKEFNAEAEAKLKSIDEVATDDIILDVGPITANNFAGMLKSAGTIVWNGPVGVFEFDQFSDGTKILANAVAQSPAFSIAGGGDTIAAIDKYGLRDKVSYISTGGGAFLELLEGKTLPAIEILEKSNN